MPRIPVESPIAVSSASPTPDRYTPVPTRARRRDSSHFSTTATATAGPSTRPIRNLPSRSRSSDESYDPFALPDRSGPSRPVHGIPSRDHHSSLAPTAREFQPARPQGLAIPSRPGSAAPGPSRNTTGMDAPGARAGQSRLEAIDLTEDDDDVEVVAVNQALPARRTGPTGPLWRDLHHIDQVTAEREQAFRDLVVDEAHDLQRRRTIPAVPQRLPRGVIRFTPPQPDAPHRLFPGRPNMRGSGGSGVNLEPVGTGAAGAPARARAPRIGLGGAVFRRGDQQIRFQADLPPRARPPPGALVDHEDDDERANLDDAINEHVNRRMPNPVRGGRHAARALREAEDAERVRLDAEINERIQQGIRHRDHGGFPGLADDWPGRMDIPFGQNIVDMVNRGLGDAGLFARIRAMRQEMGGGMPMGNEAPRDPQSIIAQVPKFEYPPPPEGFTSNFEIDSTIEIDQPASSKKFLACVYCVEPLVLQSGEKNPGDRNWALRCGHIIHQRCLEKISSPQSNDDRDNISRPEPPAELPVLGGGDGDIGAGKKGRTAKRARTTRATAKKTKTPAKPVEYEWNCPVKDCGHQHKTVLKDAEWKQDELEGAFQMYT